MKRIKITAICVSLLATLSLVGCVCPPAGYHSGMYPSGYSYSHGNMIFGGGDPCGGFGTADCGVIEYTGSPCTPQVCAPQVCAPKIVDCHTSFSHLGNGILLVGRGILDVTAAPFVIVGNLLSSGCRYEVIPHCGDVFYGDTCCQTVEPCGVSHTPCSGNGAGCETCAGGYTEGIQYNTSFQNRATTLPAPARRNNSVMQASYQEPNMPGVRFVQPR